MDEVRIGCGAGFARDRTDAAGPVVESLAAAGGRSFLIFETLAERTLALAQMRALRGEPAYLDRLDDFVAPVLARCLDSGIRIVGNFGAADPVGAALHLHALADELGCRPPRIGVVVGDNLLEQAQPAEVAAWPLEPPFAGLPDDVVAANAYLGAFPIAEALDRGADIVVTGRVADPALALGPLIHAFGWREGDWDALAHGTLAGHLLECGAQVTGGYFADPGWKDVPDADDIGFPIAEVSASGTLVITKPEGTGGLVSPATVAEQILYEIHDPAAYLTPDVVLDITAVTIAADGPDRVRVQGARGHPRPERLKATVCLDAGWIGEGEISYAGHNAAARARLAIEIVRRRVARFAPDLTVHADVIGLSSAFNETTGETLAACGRDAGDLRVRIAVEHADPALVERTLHQVETLYTNGPAGGGGVRLHVERRLRTASCFVKRARVEPRVAMIEGSP